MNNDENKLASSVSKPDFIALKQKPDPLAQSVGAITRNLQLLIENQQSIAKIRRAAYEAYITEGFTETQALELCAK